MANFFDEEEPKTAANFFDEPEVPVAKAPEAPAPKPVEVAAPRKGLMDAAVAALPLGSVASRVLEKTQPPSTDGRTATERSLTALGKGMIEGFPGGYGPKMVAGLESMLPGSGTYEEELAKEKASLEAARSEYGVPFGVGEFVGELPTFIAGGALGKAYETAALGKKILDLEKAGKALTPGLKAARTALRALGIGETTAVERLARTGDLKEAAVTGATTAALGPVFEGAGILARKLGPELGAGAVETVARRGAQAATLATPAAVLAKTSYPEEGDTAAKTKSLLGSALFAGGAAKQGIEGLPKARRAALAPIMERAEIESAEAVRPSIYQKEARRLVEERKLEAPVERMRREQAVRGQAEQEIGEYNRVKAERLRSAQKEAEGQIEARRQAEADRKIVEAERKNDYTERVKEQRTRNQQFRRAVANEQRVIETAQNMKTNAEATLNKLLTEAADIAELQRGLEAGTDPSLRGMLGKLFQDTSNRIIGAEEAVARSPGAYSPEFVNKLKATRKLIDDSYVRNTDKGGYLEDFVDDPYVRLEQYRAELMAKTQKQADANAAAKGRAASRLLADFEQEARAARERPLVPEERIRAIAEEAGLDYSQKPSDIPEGFIDPPMFGQRVDYPLKAAPASAVAPESRVVALERQRAERPMTKAQRVQAILEERATRGDVLPEPPTKAQARLQQLRLEQAEGKMGTATGETPQDAMMRRLMEERPEALEQLVREAVEREVVAGGRAVSGLRPQGEIPGEKPAFMDPMQAGKLRVLYETSVPDNIKPMISFRKFLGIVRGSANLPESKFRELQAVRPGAVPSETRLARPLELNALLRAWDKALAEKTVPSGFLARQGITYKDLQGDLALRARSLGQALEDPETREYLLGLLPSP
jgi:hypothetical protein